MLTLCVILALACAALASALRRARADAADHRRQALVGVELLAAVSQELACARAAQPTARPPARPHRCDRCAAVEVADVLFAQPSAPLLCVEAPHRPEEPRLVFAVRWGEA